MAAHLEKGLVQIYTGDGKGKSTAAFGLALRAYGQGLKVRIIQFMKSGEAAEGVNYGEINAFAKLPGISVSSYGRRRFMVKGKIDHLDLELAKEALCAARAALAEGYDLVILDEILNALYFDLLQEDEVIALLKARPERVEVVLTGRNAPPRLVGMADLVTEMKLVKHPYQQNIPARQGIEY